MSAPKLLRASKTSQIKELKLDKAALGHKCDRMKANLKNITYNDLKEQNDLNETNVELKLEIERLTKENMNQSLSMCNDKSIYKERNQELIQEIVRLKDVIKQKDKEL